MASMKQIAELANVSVTTASIVLNGKGEQQRISAETQRRVMEAARALDYRPNISAKRLRSGGETVAPVIALFWTLDTRSSLLGPFLKGVQDAMQTLEVEHELLIQPFVGSRIQDVKSLMTGTRFNGAIITNATEEDENYLNEAELNIPIVLYQRSSDKHSFVTVDNYGTGQRIARLLASRGHTRVGLILPQVSSSAIRLRKEGFLQEAASLGMAVSENHIAYGEFSESGGYKAALQIIISEERPTALFISSDQMAVGALLALREQGVQVPADMEIVGHDDYDNARYSVPPLTTVHLPIQEMAAACVHMLVDLLGHKIAPPVSRMFETQIIVRETCGGFPEKNGEEES